MKIKDGEVELDSCELCERFLNEREIIRDKYRYNRDKFTEEVEKLMLHYALRMMSASLPLQSN